MDDEVRCENIDRELSDAEAITANRDTPNRINYKMEESTIRKIKRPNAELENVFASCAEKGNRERGVHDY
ncbi:hypothetical protein GWI33_004266 [Rhynchophorus ferrugineus]|uniref:Uncharacterized protein n=1 Tax=Rhynchophorus ferrugineus TaxID=354439 RepID=A0A834IJ18_RHYFE|nr:hypothetical protein GWI33_004266 [Rhynchophorus ferrugineus]